jgi:hypothetical protein
LKFLTSSGIASGLVLGLAAVVAGAQSVGGVCLTNKGAVGLNEFLYRRLFSGPGSSVGSQVFAATGTDFVLCSLSGRRA